MSLKNCLYFFSLSILCYLRKLRVASILDQGFVTFKVKLIEKWSEKASVVWT